MAEEIHRYLQKEHVHMESKAFYIKIIYDLTIGKNRKPRYLNLGLANNCIAEIDVFKLKLVSSYCCFWLSYKFETKSVSNILFWGVRVKKKQRTTHSNFFLQDLFIDSI